MHSSLQAADCAQLCCHYRVGCARCNAGGESHCDCPAPATVLRAAHSAWPAAVRAQPGCPHPPRAHSCHMGRALRYAAGVSQSPRPAPMRWASHSTRWPWSAADSAQLSCPHNAPSEAPHSRAGESHCDLRAPAPILWGEHSTCQWPAKDCAQLGCPRRPAHSAGRCADGESHGDSPAPTRIWRAAQSARPAKDHKQIPRPPGRSPIEADL